MTPEEIEEFKRQWEQASSDPRNFGKVLLCDDIGELQRRIAAHRQRLIWVRISFTVLAALVLLIFAGRLAVLVLH